MSSRYGPSSRALHAAVATSLALLLMALTSCSASQHRSSASPPPSASPSSSPSSSANLDAATTAAAQHFLDTYVASDGAVIRHDQGGDVVSEGQAYAMLIAEAAGRSDLVPTIWGWTQRHLQRGDHLLSYHADASGRVLDPQSATDADVLAAVALVRYSGPSEAALRAAGKDLASAILRGESVALPAGPVLVAGPWAVGPPVVVNPSYWMPAAFRALAAATGDRRWTDAEKVSIALVRAGTDGGARLPADWARLTGGTITPSPAPGDGARPVQYGLDAQRVPIWFAASCAAQARAMAANWWHLLSQDDHSAASALTPTGQVIDGSPAALPLVAASAAAVAGGDPAAARRLRARAAEQARRAPTYYGDAWVVLADVVPRLAPCS